MKAPVVLFVYNRADKVKECINYLEKNIEVNDTDFFVFSDGYKNDNDKTQVMEVRQLLDGYQKISKFKSLRIIEREKNIGLANSIISGISFVLNEYDRVIVMEDDLIVSSNFLKYMNSALDYYENDLLYGSISGYSESINELKKYPHDIYTLLKGECWGWATWKNRWKNVDWDVVNYDELINDKHFCKEFNMVQYDFVRLLRKWKNKQCNSWAIRWCLHLFLNKQLTVYPKETLVNNNGFDGTGTNCGGEANIRINISLSKADSWRFEKIRQDKKIAKAVANHERAKLKDIPVIIMKILKKK